MSREVADSDDESEVITSAPSRAVSQRQEHHHSSEQPPPSTLERDPLTDVNFDDYLSPTQRLSSAVTTEERVAVHTVVTGQDNEGLNSSNDRFLDEVAPRSSACLPQGENTQEFPHSSAVVTEMGSLKKRSLCQISEPSSGDANRRKKRRSQDMSRMYQTDTEARVDEHGRQVEISGDHDLSTPRIHDTSTTEPLGLTLDASSEHLNSAASFSTVPYQPYAPHSNYFANNVSYGVPTMSSIGGHQSLNINPSSLGMGFGEINPFGRLSQISTVDDGDPELDQTRGIAEIFRNAAANSGRVADTKPEEMSISNGRSESVKNKLVAPVQLVKYDMKIIDTDDLARASTPDRTITRQPSESSPSFSPISNRAGSAERSIPAEASEAKNAKPIHKKRGRKPKNRQKTDEPTVINDDNVDELQIEEHHLARQTRATTVDSASNMSEVSVASAGSKKRKRGTKRAMAEPEAEVQPKKLPSSDLGLNDKAIIGLSPERYKPRPSRRRGRNTDPDMDIEREVKLIEAAHRKLDDQSKVDDVGAIEGENRTRKRGRKSKLKNTDQAHEEPIVVELKEEAEAEGIDEECELAQVHRTNEDEDEDELEGEPRATNITINVPPLPKPGDDSKDEPKELPPRAPEPKKRGRKKKQKLAIAEEEKTTEDVGGLLDQAEMKIQEEPMDEIVRPALAEKNFNAILPSAENSDSTKPLDIDAGKEDLGITKAEPIKEQSDQKWESPASVVKQLSSTTTANPSNPLFSSPYRIGLSRRRPIPSLLRKVDRNKELPKAIERKEKLTAGQQREREKEELERQEALENGEEYTSKDNLRDADGRLIEWDF